MAGYTYIEAFHEVFGEEHDKERQTKALGKVSKIMRFKTSTLAANNLEKDQETMV